MPLDILLHMGIGKQLNNRDRGESETSPLIYPHM